MAAAKNPSLMYPPGSGTPEWIAKRKRLDELAALQDELGKNETSRFRKDRNNRASLATGFKSTLGSVAGNLASGVKQQLRPLNTLYQRSLEGMGIAQEQYAQGGYPQVFRNAVDAGKSLAQNPPTPVQNIIYGPSGKPQIVPEYATARPATAPQPGASPMPTGQGGDPRTAATVGPGLYAAPEGTAYADLGAPRFGGPAQPQGINYDRLAQISGRLRNAGRSEASQAFLDKSQYGANVSGSMEARQRLAAGREATATGLGEAAAGRASAERVAEITALGASAAAAAQAKAQGATLGDAMKGAIEAHLNSSGDPADIGAIVAAVQDAYNGVDGGTAQGGDMNGDGKVSPEENEFNEIASALKNPGTLTPAQIERLKIRQANLRNQIPGLTKTA